MDNKYGIVIVLKPCPFCGAQPIANIEDQDDRSLELTIDCSNCQANMSSYIASGSKEAASQEKAEKLCDQWNARV